MRLVIAVEMSLKKSKLQGEGQVFVKLVRNVNRMKKIALTGNMGSGKSYVGHLIERFGVFVLDMDLVAKQVRLKNEDKILEMFAIDDINELAHLIFDDSQKKEQLEKFLYTFMLEVMNDFFKQHEDEKICVVEVPLLFEKGWDIYFDEVWCVSTTIETALNRLLQYRQIGKETALSRLQHQMDMKEKEQKSDYIIYNNEGDDVKAQVKMRLIEEGYHVEQR